MKTLPLDRLSQLLHFTNGVLVWKVSRKGPARAGDVAGCVKPCGYVRVVVDGTRLWLHRVVWAMHHQQWPEGEIDHINGIRHDNRIENLRCVSPAINQQNQRAARNNAVGLLGVVMKRGKFSARIKTAGRTRYLGSFDDAETAHAAYVEAKRVLHPGCTI